MPVDDSIDICGLRIWNPCCVKKGEVAKTTQRALMQRAKLLRHFEISENRKIQKLWAANQRSGIAVKPGRHISLYIAAVIP